MSNLIFVQHSGYGVYQNALSQTFSTWCCVQLGAAAHTVAGVLDGVPTLTKGEGGSEVNESPTRMRLWELGVLYPRIEPGCTVLMVMTNSRREALSALSCVQPGAAPNILAGGSRQCMHSTGSSVLTINASR